MSTPHFKNIEIAQGADFFLSWNWYGGGTFMAVIEQIDPGYPTKIKVTDHLLNSLTPTPVILSGIKGMEVLNSKDTGLTYATRIDDDHFSIPISTRGLDWDMNSGELTYYKPVDLTNYTARSQIRKRWHDKDFLLELTTENGGITLTPANGGIQLNITAAQTAALTADRMVCDVELIESGIVTRVGKADLYLDRESTR